MSARDDLWVDPNLTAEAEKEAVRLARVFKLDVTDAKEVYRTIMRVAVEFTLSRQPASRLARCR